METQKTDVQIMGLKTLLELSIMIEVELKSRCSGLSHTFGNSQNKETFEESIWVTIYGERQLVQNEGLVNYYMKAMLNVCSYSHLSDNSTVENIDKDIISRVYQVHY